MSYESRNLLPYARELGLRSGYVSPLVAGYPSYIPGVSIVEVDGRYLPDGVLGMTDLHNVWLRNDLGSARDEVLQHEHEHIKNPDAPEHRIRELTRMRCMMAGKTCVYH